MNSVIPRVQHLLSSRFTLFFNSTLFLGPFQIHSPFYWFLCSWGDYIKSKWLLHNFLFSGTCDLSLQTEPLLKDTTILSHFSTGDHFFLYPLHPSPALQKQESWTFSNVLDLSFWNSLMVLSLKYSRCSIYFQNTHPLINDFDPELNGLSLSAPIPAPLQHLQD